MTRFLWILVVLGLSGPVVAQEFIEVEGGLSDTDFYRLLACAAPPGGDCQKRIMKWPEDKRRPLRVGLTSQTEALAPWQRRLYSDAMSNAVTEINRVGAGIRLQVTSPPHDVELHVVNTPPGSVMTGTGVPLLEGEFLPLGRVAVRSRNGNIKGAIIAISVETRRRAIASVVLEELVQSLGLLTDIRSPVYRRSIFSEDSNSGTRLRGQDAMALRRHYPPN